MKVRYRNDLYGNYMLIEIPKGEDINQYSFKMLERNQIAGVLNCQERMEDGKSYWYADISKKRNLVQEFQDKEIRLEDMIVIFQQITPIVEELRNYLLNENMMVMDPEYIYKDLENDNLSVLILPWIQEENTIHKLAEFFLEKMNHRDENGVNAAYLFYRQQSQEHFSWYRFLPVLEKESILKRQKSKEHLGLEEKENLLHREDSAAIWEESNIKSLEEPPIPKEKLQSKNRIKVIASIFLLMATASLIFGMLPYTNSVMRISGISLSILLFIVFLFLMFSKGKEKEKKQIYLEDEIIPKQEMDLGMKETVFFNACEEEYFKLQWKEKGREKQFILKEFPCTVGKMKDEVSIVISDLSVSRIHCRFIEKEDKVCVMDLNSTNGTFLNGLPLKNGEILEIEKNDEIHVGKVKVSVV